MPDDINNNPQNPFNPFQPVDNNSNQDQKDNQNNSMKENISNADITNSTPLEQKPNMPQMPQTSQQTPQDEYPQDERIVDYLVTQVIPALHPDWSADKVVEEKDRLYKILENGIFETAYNQLSEDHRTELDTLMKYGANIPAIQTFFIEKIPNIQEQLGKYMEEFVQRYLKGEI